MVRTPDVLSGKLVTSRLSSRRVPRPGLTLNKYINLFLKADLLESIGPSVTKRQERSTRREAIAVFAANKRKASSAADIEPPSSGRSDRLQAIGCTLSVSEIVIEFVEET